MSRLSYLYMQLESAWLSLYTVRFRSLLAGLGITIGVAAVILVMAVGEGSRKKILDQLQALGSNLLVVNPGPSKISPGITASADTLKLTDAETLEQKLGRKAVVSPEVYGQVLVAKGNLSRNAPLMGVASDFFRARNFFPGQGRTFNQNEDKSMRKVCLLGFGLANELFPRQQPVDKKVRIHGMEFQVIGVLEPKGDFGWFHPDQLVIVPLRVAQRQLLGIDHLNSIVVKVLSREQMPELSEDIVRILRSQHRLSTGLSKDQLDFNVISQSELIKTFNRINRTFTSLLVSIATISLLVGGIGIMNIMLANLSERTGEIGIRKAVGAARVDILAQFLFEALTLTMAGAGLGILLGFGVSALVDQLSPWQTLIRGWSVLVAAGFAAAVGLIFGIYPAWRASGLDPIEALRRE